MANAQPRTTSRTMTCLTPRTDRRRLLRALAAGLCAAAAPEALWPRPAHAATTPGTFPDGSTILVGGPADGTLSAVAEQLAESLLQGRPAGTSLHRKTVGGDDGVTGANQFEARVPPDGQTALLTPGAAALAWLVGDPRAHFDVAKWLPIMAGVSPGLVCSRLPAATLRPGARLRIAAAGPVGPDLPGLLAVDLLGLKLAPVFGVRDHLMASQALRAGAVDAVFLHGPQARQQAAALNAAGAPPLFAMGVPDDAEAIQRDPLMPDLPTLPELSLRLRGTRPSGQLYTAWQACAASVNLQFALVLPVLSPAAMVALWRTAATRMAAAPEPLDGDLRTLAAPEANTVLSAISAEAPALLALRRWLSERLNWRPT